MLGAITTAAAKAETKRWTPLGESGDSWEQVLIDLRREAVTDTLSTLETWSGEE